MNLYHKNLKDLKGLYEFLKTFKIIRVSTKINKKWWSLNKKIKSI